MQVRLFLLCILCFATTSFFWEDEEKQLKQLHQNGEVAMQNEAYDEAKTAFEELLNRVSVTLAKKYRVDWPTYVDLVIRLVTACEKLGNIKEAEQAINLLLAKRPPDALLPQIKLIKARLAAYHSSPAAAYTKISHIAERFSTEGWTNKDLSFFHALKYSLNRCYDGQLQKAKRYLATGFYSEAIAIYEEILTAIENGVYPKAQQVNSLIDKKIRYRLAECRFLAAAEHKKSLAFCDTLASDGKTADTIDCEMLYLSALRFREKKEFEKALALFQTYMQSGNQIDLAHYDQAFFEIGYFYYQNQNRTEAKRYFEQLQNRKGKPSLVAALYLARLLLEENKPKQIETLLAPVTQAINTKDPLRIECYFLRGLAAYALGKYPQAKEFFELSLPSKPFLGACYQQSLYHLGWSCLHLGNDPLKSIQVRTSFLKTAEKVFEQLQDFEPEAAFLSLAQLYILRNQHLHDIEALKRVEALLEKNSTTFSLDGKIHALLLRAEASQDYAEKEAFFVRAIDERFLSTSLYGQAWYNRGLNHLQEGLARISHQHSCRAGHSVLPDVEEGSEWNVHEPFRGTPLKADGETDVQGCRMVDEKCGLEQSEHNPALFAAATTAFEKAFCLIKKQDQQQMAHILKLEAKTTLFYTPPMMPLALLDKLLSQFDETVEEKEETLYLRGLMASCVAESSYFSLAEKFLLQVIQYDPIGSYTDDALHVLATLYYGEKKYKQARKMFIQLATEYSNSSYAPGAWFWAAEATAKLEEDPSIYRCHVYEKYPKSDQAAEAYFRQYTYSDYLEGSPQALKHLYEFQNHFAHNPLLIVVHYLIGMNEEKFELTNTSYKKGLKAFDRYFQNSTTPTSRYIYFHYQTMLELANTLLTEEVEPQICEQLLTSIVADFSTKHHPHTTLLKEKSPYPPLFEESEFRLVQYNLKHGKKHLAQKQLTSMLTHYSEAGISDGLYLSLVWQEFGKLATQCGDYETALTCFEIASECGYDLTSTSGLTD